MANYYLVKDFSDMKKEREVASLVSSIIEGVPEFEMALENSFENGFKPDDIKNSKFKNELFQYVFDSIENVYFQYLDGEEDEDY